MPSIASASDIHRGHEQRLAKQREQLTATSMPQKHDSQRSRQRMYEIQAYAEELKQQEAMAFSMSEVTTLNRVVPVSPPSNADILSR